MRYLTLNEVLDLYRQVVEQTGGSLGIHNLRIGHAAMETFLVLNGYEIDAPVDEQEKSILRVASGKMKREEFTEWLKHHLVEKKQE